MSDTAPGLAGEAAYAPAERGSRVIDLTPETIELADPQPSPRTARASGTGASSRPAGLTPETARPQLRQVLRGFLDRVRRSTPSQA